MPEESEESRANDVRPYNVPFPKRVNNSSALSGISSKRGDYFCCKRYENNKSHTQNKHSESLRCKYRKRQTKAFAQHNTLLPIERWNDMMDVLERLRVSDAAILRAHNSRGFTYLSGIIEEVDLSHNEVREAAAHMFERMDADLVFSDPEISPGCKRMFAELRRLPCPRIDKMAYLRGLVSQGVYNLKNTGVSNTFFATSNYLKKRKKRTGRR